MCSIEGGGASGWCHRSRCSAGLCGWRPASLRHLCEENPSRISAPGLLLQGCKCATDSCPLLPGTRSKPTSRIGQLYGASNSLTVQSERASLHSAIAQNSDGPNPTRNRPTEIEAESWRSQGILRSCEIVGDGVSVMRNLTEWRNPAE